ncbi:hypothetical protein RUMHYD_01712 [Blautia hydrogenotrophica DSM 10507]|uniref:Uncharacterized protein n=1 Tax=Blautia hydrogenotrophica (strain DSM 10507 / JCM 14656 / S5a33) TaxID=476272 RepID=C0CLJ0_BLAHS|nr:hypothetical protein RUMHYD_01712 [Blautia hydrogenotrophica DSM 10507]
MGGCAPVVFYSRFVAFSLHRKLCSLCNKKPSGQDAHAAMRNFIARRCCGGAQSGTRPSKIEGELKWACPLYSILGKTLSRGCMKDLSYHRNAPLRMRTLQ